MQGLKNIGQVMAANKGWMLILLAVVLVAAAVGGFIWWRRRRPGRAPILGAPAPMESSRLLKIRQRFLANLPFLHRAAVLDLPAVVVLGPAGSGKSKLIDLDVDWQRQARQFLPSYTDDSALQFYLGPDAVVQELSATLMEDESPQVRHALRRLWKATFGKGQRGLAVVVLDTRWLSETPADEVRRAAQLIRGKLNLLSEVNKGAVETRICLTHMDGLEGFPDFAQLLKAHHVPLSFPLPGKGEEGQLASLLQAQQQYLALGLTSLPVEAFERLERFYSQGGRPFEALAGFVGALLEGGTLSFPPRLTRVYLSSISQEARAEGTLAASAEASDAQVLHQRYKRTHMKRAALIAGAVCLPMLLAYGNVSIRMRDAQGRVLRFEETVQRLRDQAQGASGSVVQDQVLEAGESLDGLWRSTGYWPFLNLAYRGERDDLRRRLARGIREAHIRPALERCHQQPETCRPEQVVYMLATLHASRDEGLGEFVLSSLRTTRQWSFASKKSAGDESQASNMDAKRTWVTAVGLLESLVGDYVQISDTPWQAPTTPDADWARWPFKEVVTLEGQLGPWQIHFKRLEQLLHSPSMKLSELEALTAELESLQEERIRLQSQLDDAALFAALPKVLDLLNASEARVNTSTYRGLPSTLKAIEWLNKNRDVLAAILKMEEEAYLGMMSVQKMSVAELLIRDGVWQQTTGNGPFRVTVLQGTFEFRPQESSSKILQAIIRYYEQKGRLPFGGAAREGGDAAFDESASGASARLEFDTRIRPLVDEFTQRLKNSKLSVEEASQRQEQVRRKVEQFARIYRQGLFQRVNAYRFTAPTPAFLSEELSRLTQPSSELVDMLRDVSQRASLEPLEGIYYESLRNAVAPFKPISQLMRPDESGNYAALAPYRALVAQLYDEVNAISKKGSVLVASATPAEPPTSDSAPAQGGIIPGRAEGSGGGAAQLTEMLTPLGRIGLAMLLEQENSYLRKVDAWLDSQGLIGELRQPFRLPFLVARELAQQEIERTLEQQWTSVTRRLLQPLLDRYPFAANATQEVDAGDLEVLRRTDGAFWEFVDRVLSPVCVERGNDWVLRGPLRDRLRMPPRALAVLGRLSQLSRMLWDKEGRPRALILQVMPLPLPAAPTPDSFITMGSLKCGKTAAFAYNQNPTWQDFPLSWREQQTASIVLELRSPTQQTAQYLYLEKPRSSWSCFRLLESSVSTGNQSRVWRLRARASEESSQPIEVRFGVKGDPWLAFREVPL